MRSRDEALSRLSMRNPWHLLATGFGSGLSPVVPGTMGSLAAIPFWYLMTFLPWQLYSLVVMMSICIGVYLCHRTAKDMGTHDHGSIVWDEVAGKWITLMALPTLDWQWVAAGFGIFRTFDMCKPRPPGHAAPTPPGQRPHRSLYRGSRGHLKKKNQPY